MHMHRFPSRAQRAELVASALSSLRNVRHLAIDQPQDPEYNGGPLTAAMLQPLSRFHHLTYLSLRLLDEDVAASPPPLQPEQQEGWPALGAALLSLDALVGLELSWYQLAEGAPGRTEPSASLVADLRSLCHRQLQHVTLPLSALRRMAADAQRVSQRVAAPISRIRSVSNNYEYWDASTCASLGVLFPELAHVWLSYRGGQPRSMSSWPPLPALSSLRLDLEYVLSFSSAGDTSAELSAACLCLRWIGRERQLMRTLLRNARHVKQLAIVRQLPWWDAQVRPDDSLFSAASPLQKLTYLQLVSGMCLSDWQFLLTAASPPAFASSLTHLLLECPSGDCAAVAALLNELPATYPNLTHCHVGVACRAHVQPPGAEWAAAMRSLQQRLGAAWCEHSDEVLAWREDVRWRLSQRLPTDPRSGWWW